MSSYYNSFMNPQPGVASRIGFILTLFSAVVMVITAVGFESVVSAVSPKKWGPAEKPVVVTISVVALANAYAAYQYPVWARLNLLGMGAVATYAAIQNRK